MKSIRAAALKHAPALVFVAATLSAAPDPAKAQGEPKDAPNRRQTFSSIPRPPDPTSIRERQSGLRATEVAAARKAAPRAQDKLALAQIVEDYRHIQVINNRMLGAAISSETLDYKDISETTKEIGRRAVRLKSNLSLPAPEEMGKRAWSYGHAQNASQLKAALRRLDDLIMGFIASPFFKNRDVVDAKAGARASGDLEEIIELSRAVSADAARLCKNPKAP
ncbi:MAG: hypothetical protein LC802_15135 [Acidobacteria bacterium]|nr:hypothetical protein [Acidobacteriota bacterium]